MSEDIDGLKIDILTLGNRINRLAEQVKSGDVRVVHQDTKFRVVIERAASTKGIDGFKVEVNGDDFDIVQNQIEALYSYAKTLTDIVFSVNIEKKSDACKEADRLAKQYNAVMRYAMPSPPPDTEGQELGD